MTSPVHYLIRHGQTEFNAAGRYQGQCDSPLTELGRSQARAIGQELAVILGDRAAEWRLVTSPLGRARHTAELIAECMGHAEIIEDQRIQEVCFGDWERKLRADVIAEIEATLPDVPAHLRMFHAPNGETLDEALSRARDWLAWAATQPNLIVISHGIFGRLLRGLYGQLAHEDMLTLTTPQDAFFRLSGGRIERIAVSALAE